MSSSLPFIDEAHALVPPRHSGFPGSPELAFSKMKMRIFLSAVSSQLKNCRDSLASDLRAIGCTVKVQEDFQQQGGTLLEKLELYVADCDRVIAIVGDAYGFEPECAVGNLLHAQRSYTQWEYFFARGERLNGNCEPPKEIFVYFASPTFIENHPVEQDEESAGRQRKFIQGIRESGKDWSTFDHADQLCRRVLRDGWKMQSRPRRPISLPFASIGKLFKGRDEFLAELRNNLQVKGETLSSGVVGTVLHGLGGVGKTRLAVEFAWQHVTDYSAILFVLADSPQNLRRNLASLVGPLVLNLAERYAEDEEVRIAAAVHWLEDHPGWFLILDNVDSEEAANEVEEFLSCLNGGQVLITSRLSRWGGCVEPLELDVLGERDSATFLLERTNQNRENQETDEKDALELAQELDGLALALEQAGAYIQRRRIAIFDYLQLWRKNEALVRQWHDKRLMKYPQSLAVTWQTTLDQLRPNDSALLRLLAWFAPDSIPVSILELESADGIFQQAVDLCSNERLAEPSTEPGLADVRDALAALADFSMLRWDSDSRTVVVHRVVQEILRSQPIERRERMSADSEKIEMSKWAGLAAKLLNCGYPQGEHFENWGLCSSLLPHVLAIKESFLSYRMEPSAVARLLCEAGSYLRQRFELEDSDPLCQLSLEIRQEIHKVHHEDVGDSLYQVAWVKQRKELLPQSILLYEQAMHVYEATTGKTCSKYADVLDNLGVAYDDLGQHDKAESCYLECLSIRKLIHGTESFDVANCMNNLATSYGDRHQYDDAQKLYEDALQICTRLNKLHDPKATIIMINLANRYQSLKRLDDAEKLFQQAHEIRISTLGYVDRLTMQSLRSLALCVFRRDAERALSVCSEFINNASTTVGEYEHCIATASCLQSEIARAIHRPEVAEKAQLTALRIFEKAPASKGREIVDICTSLGHYYYQLGDYESAEPFELRAATLQEQILPPGDYSVATGWFNYAMTLRNIGRTADAQHRLQYALELVESANPSRPQILIHWRLNLALMLLLQQETTHASAILEECLEMNEHQRDVTTARILILEYVIAQITGIQHVNYLGQLKNMLHDGPLVVPDGVASVWRIPTFKSYLEEHLPFEADFIKELLAAVDGTKTVELVRFDAWRNADFAP